MGLQDITERSAVLDAIAEFDELGRPEFLRRYGFGTATRWYVEHDGHRYDAKALIGVAHKFQFGRPLTSHDFYGGTPTNTKLEQLGFTIINTDEEAPVQRDGRVTGFWILAARPDRFRVLDAVRGRDEEWWRTGGRRLQAGHKVAIWKYQGSEKTRGVVAFGEVLTDPEMVTLDDREDTYWIGGDPLALEAPRVRVRYVLRPDPPLWAESAPQGSVLRRLTVARALGGTAFIVSPSEWQELVALAGGWPAEAPAELVDLEKELMNVAQRGQGFGLTSAQRKAVEDRAMAVITDRFEADGWAVENVSAKRPYDLVATRGSERRQIEVKGTTTTAPDAVLLTKNEVKAARDAPDCAVLAIVHGIVLSRDEPPTATDGTPLVIHPWMPLDEALLALAYRYAVPSP